MPKAHDPAEFYGPGDAIKPREYLTARELWDELDITREPWTPPGMLSCSWVFRGMRDADLGLLPRHGVVRGTSTMWSQP